MSRGPAIWATAVGAGAGQRGPGHAHRAAVGAAGFAAALDRRRCCSSLGVVAAAAAVVLWRAVSRGRPRVLTILAPLPRPVAYLVVFVASCCTLILELVAGRILAPFIGVSLYTWTSIIGVVLAGHLARQLPRRAHRRPLAAAPHARHPARRRWAGQPGHPAADQHRHGDPHRRPDRPEQHARRRPAVRSRGRC